MPVIVMLPGIALGDALHSLKSLADKTLSVGYSVDYGGQSRQLMQESHAFMFTFLFALVIIFLALAAQFESFRDPLIILVSVPMSIMGALIFVALGIGNATLNIYTEVGFVTLMGLISKHGILIVEFAKMGVEEGKPLVEATLEGAKLRLRPILMTSFAFILGVLPLVLATGPGAEMRRALGTAVFSGMIGVTFFGLLFTPVFYVVIRRRKAKAAESHLSPAAPETIQPEP